MQHHLGDSVGVRKPLAKLLQIAMVRTSAAWIQYLYYRPEFIEVELQYIMSKVRHAYI
jgi:hypothetical protein